MFNLLRSKSSMVAEDAAMPGRDTAIPTAETHAIYDRPLKAPVPDGMEQVIFGMGCFWGVERMFWKVPGVVNTAVGYAAGYTPNPTYEEVCSGKTGHNEVVRVVYDPAKVSFEDLLRVFWEGHDPTQGMRQGNDVGTQYRSGIYTFTDAQAKAAHDSKDAFAPELAKAGLGAISTEILSTPTFYFAESYHQQYLEKNPRGYCGIGGTGVTCPIGTGVTA